MVAPVMAGREKEYYAWVDMRRRCNDPKMHNYDAYGGRGIAVCQIWQDSFEQFYRDVGPAPSKLHSLDRVDNDRGYSPDNCKWSTSKQQARNRRSSKFVEAFGECKTVAEWLEDDRCEATNKYLIFDRINRGWDVEKAIATPARKVGKACTTEESFGPS